LGDPLVDIGTLLNYWPDPADTEDSKRFSYDGMQRVGLPSRAAVADRYAAKSGLDLAYIGWYEAFALWKSGTVVQQLHHRWKVGDSTDPRMETVADGLPRLIQNAIQLLTRNH
ncbi:MAG: phosphotransferase family protein, partial [Gammaproteobacteria bacterium]|nr:phosphotransferase family protein [Gammaproteobacteria bacterium]